MQPTTKKTHLPRTCNNGWVPWDLKESSAPEIKLWLCWTERFEWCTKSQVMCSSCSCSCSSCCCCCCCRCCCCCCWWWWWLLLLLLRLLPSVLDTGISKHLLKLTREDTSVWQWWGQGCETKTRDLSPGWIMQSIHQSPFKCFPADVAFDWRYFYNNVTGCSTWEDPCERWRYDIHVPSSESSRCGRRPCCWPIRIAAKTFEVRYDLLVGQPRDWFGQPKEVDKWPKVFLGKGVSLIRKPRLGSWGPKLWGPQNQNSYITLHTNRTTGLPKRPIVSVM